MEPDPVDTERLRAALGPRADHYLGRFEKIERAGGGWLAGFNPAAFLHSTGWFWYRRMYGLALLNLIAPVLVLFLLVFVLQWLVPEDNSEALKLLFVSGYIGYLLLVFVLLPVYADALYYRHLKNRKFEVKRPSAWTALGALALIVIPATMAWIVVEAQRDYTHRAMIKEAERIAGAQRAPITEFYLAQRRLPDAQEAVKFHYAEPMKYTASVGWDAARKAIVATMAADRFKGQRFEIVAEEKGGSLVWTCRRIDLEAKFLVPSCRD